MDTDQIALFAAADKKVQGHRLKFLRVSYMIVGFLAYIDETLHGGWEGNYCDIVSPLYNNNGYITLKLITITA